MSPATCRTVLGDIEAGELGVTYAHEHLVIDGGRPVELSPDFLLADVELIVEEVRSAAALGLRSVVDAMPADCGRNVRKLADISRRTGVQIIASTGLHHARYYGPSHWSERLSARELAGLFIADVVDGIDAHDYSGPLVARTEHRAGVIKVAGSEGQLSARDERVFAAGALAHRTTGAPILTHCEAGTGALEQLRFLSDRGVEPGHVTLSHVDKVVDRGYHRELLTAGAFAEYDQGFRWRDAENGTLRLLEWMVEDGLGDQVMLGMDAARQGYYRVYGGTPGLAFLLDAFSGEMEARGRLDAATRTRFFVDNPARAFAFGSSG